MGFLRVGYEFRALSKGGNRYITAAAVALVQTAQNLSGFMVLASLLNKLKI